MGLMGMASQSAAFQLSFLPFGALGVEPYHLIPFFCCRAPKDLFARKHKTGSFNAECRWQELCEKPLFMYRSAEDPRRDFTVHPKN
jgi:hypothetical protein